jgi:hypothetical protein
MKIMKLDVVRPSTIPLPREVRKHHWETRLMLEMKGIVMLIDMKMLNQKKLENPIQNSGTKLFHHSNRC